MREQIIVRPAVIGDLRQLAKLFDLYRQFYRKESDVSGAELFLEERIRNNESRIFVAEAVDGGLVGFTQLYPGFTSLGMARSWTLNDLYVSEGARRQGVGRLLMKAAYELAMETGARSINLETQIENTKAQALYESLGYESETGFRFYSKQVKTGHGQ